MSDDDDISDEELEQLYARIDAEGIPTEEEIWAEIDRLNAEALAEGGPPSTRAARKPTSVPPEWADPEPRDEDDPEYQEEMFRIFRMKGWTPEDLRDKQYASKYAEWLKTAPPEED